ncbi:MAG: hypothetical protein ABI560_18395, partial [Myxococcales bacterium]
MSFPSRSTVTRVLSLTLSLSTLGWTDIAPRPGSFDQVPEDTSPLTQVCAISKAVCPRPAFVGRGEDHVHGTRVLAAAAPLLAPSPATGGAV